MASSNKFKEVFSYDGITYWDLIKNDIERIYCETFLQIYSNYQSALRIINSIKPEFVLSMNDVLSFEKTVINAAKNCKIPTFVSQHGLLQKPKPGYPPLYADKILLWGKLCSRTLREIGCDENKFVLIGNPSYDEWFTYLNSEIDKSRIYRDLGIDKNLTIILCSISPKSHVRADSFRQDNITPIIELLKIVKENDSLFLIVKLHPGESPESYENLVHQFNVSNCKVIRTYDVRDLLSISDLLVMVTTSTIALESYMFGKYVIYVNFTGLRDEFPWAEFNAGIIVHKPPDLKKMLYEILNNEELTNNLKIGMKKFVKFALHEFDGKAALRTLDYLKG